MKQTIGILVAMLFCIGIASATTSVDTNWNGAGSFDTHFIAGDDAQADFWTNGNFISGSFQATDSDNNPYGYGVDSVEAKVKSSVVNGMIAYQFNRNDAKTSYGEAGQESYTEIWGDTASFGWKSTSNYASLKSCNYGWQSNGQITATGNQQIYHSFFNDVNDDKGAEIMFIGNAVTTITDMSETSGKSSFTFGKGCGCYTNAEVDIVGSGTFDLNAYANNSIVTDTGITTDGFLNIHSEFGRGFHYNNFALSGN